MQSKMMRVYIPNCFTILFVHISNYYEMIHENIPTLTTKTYPKPSTSFGIPVSATRTHSKRLIGSVMILFLKDYKQLFHPISHKREIGSR